MKAFLAAMFLLGLLRAASAQEMVYTINKTWADGYSFMLNLADSMKSMCSEPRAHTPQRCADDFNAVHFRAAYAGGLQLQFLGARALGNLAEAAEIEKRWLPAREEFVRMAHELDRVYGPPQTTSQAPATSPTLAGDGKPVGKRPPRIDTNPRRVPTGARQ